VVFEAHSTDYQLAPALQALVAGHFAILKVGPELTYALREAIFALDAIADELLPARAHGVRAVLERRMLQQPNWWRGHHATDDRVARLYSLSDRARYYWPDPDVDAAVTGLLGDLATIPPTLVSQFMPRQYAAWRSGGMALTPDALIRHRVDEVLARYDDACSQTGCIRPR
jgi:D-tagatose-1,6-bisphosphate aldolase subunit GatZ/KbaZ